MMPSFVFRFVPLALVSCLTLVLSGCFGSSEKAVKPILGADYLEIAPPIPKEKSEPLRKAAFPNQIDAQGTLEVLAFFWYGCPSCKRFEPMLEKWAKRHQDKVTVYPVPAPLGAVWSAHARLFWLGRILLPTTKLPQLHQAFYTAIQGKRQALLTDSAQSAFFQEEFGINPLAFSAARARLEGTQKAALDYMRTNNLRSVPAFIIDGRYIVMENDHPDRMLAVADKLIEKLTD